MTIFLLVLLLIVLNNSTSLYHDQTTQPLHQRIVVEAYKLLKLQLSKEDIGFGYSGASSFNKNTLILAR